MAIDFDFCIRNDRLVEAISQHGRRIHDSARRRLTIVQNKHVVTVKWQPDFVSVCNADSIKGFLF